VNWQTTEDIWLGKRRQEASLLLRSGLAYKAGVRPDLALPNNWLIFVISFALLKNAII
jgi:hypothetical protein